MWNVLFSLLLGGLTLTAISLQKTYGHIPKAELKRRARGNDDFAQMLFKAVGYGVSLDVLLWILIGISSAAFFVIAANLLPWFAAFFVSMALVLFGFVWLPNRELTTFGAKIASLITPGVVWLLNYVGPPLERFGSWLQKHRPFIVSTGLYEREDLLDLLSQQQRQPDNRIADEELKIAAHALQFGSKLVRDVMVPTRMVKIVNTSEDIGPLLMDALHKSGYSRFPVYEGKKQNIVGTLYMRDLVTAREGGKVGSVMKKEVYYVHEEENLEHALKAFLKTKHHLFIVVNGFEEMVGIITIEDILEQILGRQIIDEFDQYDNVRAVAQIQAVKEHEEHTES